MTAAVLLLFHLSDRRVVATFAFGKCLFLGQQLPSICFVQFSKCDTSFAVSLLAVLR